MTPSTLLNANNIQLASLCPATRAPDSVLRTALRAQRAGGAACQYNETHSMETCWDHGGQAHLIWGHDASTSSWVDSTAHKFMSWVASHDDWSAIVGACKAGAIGGVISSIKFTEGETLVEGAVGGCITGDILWYFTK